MKLNTLDSIIDDILLELRNHNISESEPISRLQVEQWITQYRAVLIKQDIDKGRDINPAYEQTIYGIGLELVENIEYNTLIFHRLKSDTKIPKAIDFHYKSGITSILDLHGNEIQLMSEKRSNMQKYRRYTDGDYTAYLKDDYLYLNGPMIIEKIEVNGIFENPCEVPGFDYTGPYPIPANMLPTLKELIFAKELKITLPTDNKNNSSNDLENINAK